MYEEKRRIADELMLQMIPLVALNESMTEDEGYCKKEIEKLLWSNH